MFIYVQKEFFHKVVEREIYEENKKLTLIITADYSNEYAMTYIRLLECKEEVDHPVYLIRKGDCDQKILDDYLIADNEFVVVMKYERGVQQSRICQIGKPIDELLDV